MKTVILTISLLTSVLFTKAQVVTVAVSYAYDPLLLLSEGKLTPVYFNFSCRQLKDIHKNKIEGIDFLNLCRSIKDSAVQLQVARYDAFTRDKQRTGVIALGGGFSAIGLLGSAAASSSGGQANDIMATTLAFFGGVALLAIPVAAIYSSVPHQKRKAVLFRDLPIAYNHYVEIQP